jgi:hypothetical protein
MKPTVLKLLDTPAKKQTRTTLDTLLITPDVLRGWRNPPFQRPLKVNTKVMALAEQIKSEGGVLPGVITLGVLDRVEYLLDGQHRREAFLLSECAEGFTDVRKHFFETMADMGEEFVNLNSQLVRLRPDDVLRGLEGTIEGLALIRKECPYVGYDMIRRGERSPILSMSMVLRAWEGSASDVPKSGGVSALELAKRTTPDEAAAIVDFLSRAYSAWGRDLEYARLWGGLNLTLSMWLWRRLVITQYSPKTPKLTKADFEKCLMSMSADATYLEWLVGRQLTDRDRSPAYNRIKNIFARRVTEMTGKTTMLPSPAWAANSGRHR